MNTEIVIRLAGGLGNQLFQFAAAFKLAKKYGVLNNNIYFDTRFLQSYEAKHKFEIGFISNIFACVQIGSSSLAFVSFASRFRLARIFDRRIGPIELVSSIEHLKSVDLSSTVKQVLLDGYFQHPEVLFEDQELQKISNNLFKSNSRLISLKRETEKYIGVHIRRGDYISSKKAARVFRTIPMEYYCEALDKFPADYKIFVFSDDPGISNSFARDVNGIDVRQLNLSLQEEFFLLMSCDHHVISNSTFSWWAACLGHKPDGRVISPRDWYCNKQRSLDNPLLLPYFELIDA